LYAASVAGYASGEIGIPLLDTNAPPATATVLATAGQSRVWVSWSSNVAPDVASYRVYYRGGSSGPPWDGTAAVEGAPSPVTAVGTNLLLRGLAKGTNYFVAVAAVDSSGNEGPLTSFGPVTTAEAPPTAPTGVAANFGADGTNVLMWALSEDDGYNDRDVIRYDIWRAVMPGGNYNKVGQVSAGISLYSEPTIAILPSQYLLYAVEAVDAMDNYSGMALANGGLALDSVGDGIPNWWRAKYFSGDGMTTNSLSCATCDADGTGQNNLFKYVTGLDPTNSASVFVLNITGAHDLLAQQDLTFFPVLDGRTYTPQFSTNLALGIWLPLTGYAGPVTNGNQVTITDTNAVEPRKFYRIKISLP
jgi:hypothetical protein